MEKKGISDTNTLVKSQSVRMLQKNFRQSHMIYHAVNRFKQTNTFVKGFETYIKIYQTFGSKNYDRSQNILSLQSTLGGFFFSGT